MARNKTKKIYPTCGWSVKPGQKCCFAWDRIKNAGTLKNNGDLHVAACGYYKGGRFYNTNKCCTKNMFLTTQVNPTKASGAFCIEGKTIINCAMNDLKDDSACRTENSGCRPCFGKGNAHPVTVPTNACWYGKKYHIGPEKKK
jgi:hypothetical protein